MAIRNGAIALLLVAVVLATVSGCSAKTPFAL